MTSQTNSVAALDGYFTKPIGQDLILGEFKPLTSDIIYPSFPDLKGSDLILAHENTHSAMIGLQEVLIHSYKSGGEEYYLKMRSVNETIGELMSDVGMLSSLKIEAEKTGKGYAPPFLSSVAKFANMVQIPAGYVGASKEKIVASAFLQTYDKYFVLFYDNQGHSFPELKMELFIKSLESLEKPKGPIDEDTLLNVINTSFSRALVRYGKSHKKRKMVMYIIDMYHSRARGLLNSLILAKDNPEFYFSALKMISNSYMSRIFKHTGEQLGCCISSFCDNYDERFVADKLNLVKPTCGIQEVFRSWNLYLKDLIKDRCCMNSIDVPGKEGTIERIARRTTVVDLMADMIEDIMNEIIKMMENEEISCRECSTLVDEAKRKGLSRSDLGELAKHSTEYIRKNSVSILYPQSDYIEPLIKNVSHNSSKIRDYLESIDERIRSTTH